MRKLITFIFGLVLLALTVAMLFLVSAIYDTGARTSIETYFFQTDNLSVMRPGAPVRESEMGETAMRDMLIKKFVTEYFYAIPDVANIEHRMGKNSTMFYMSDPRVFNAWLDGEAAGIQSMADHGMMRTVAIDGEIYKEPDSDYWVVPYVLYTWTKPNDMSISPQVTRGVLLMNVLYQPGIRDNIDAKAFDAGKYLKRGYNDFGLELDPSIVFKFRVMDLERH